MGNERLLGSSWVHCFYLLVLQDFRVIVTGLFTFRSSDAFDILSNGNLKIRGSFNQSESSNFICYLSQHTYLKKSVSALKFAIDLKTYFKYMFAKFNHSSFSVSPSISSKYTSRKYGPSDRIKEVFNHIILF